ncbi:MAG TPA: response regulator [Polyangiaceae bacterium]|jgi:two-component system phosphate regulon response regulator PhoB
MARILIVEDEVDIRDVVAFNLRQAGHAVIVATRGRQALDKLAEKPALVILDLMLPDMSGIEICKTIKHTPQTANIPVLMLTARGEEIDRVVGFEVGADDYIVKPFSMRELLLRVGAILRRAGAAPAKTRGVIELGDLKIDVDAHRVWIGVQEVELTALEFRLLMTFYERRDRVQSRATLLDDVWGVSPDLVTRTVDTHVKRLREKLGNTELIETVRGVGYRLTIAGS